VVLQFAVCSSSPVQQQLCAAAAVCSSCVLQLCAAAVCCSCVLQLCAWRRLLTTRTIKPMCASCTLGPPPLLPPRSRCQVYSFSS